VTAPDVPDRASRVVTVAAVLLVAAVAAIVSYAHMREVADRAGEGWRALLLPLSVDGLVVAASMVLLTRRRAGLPGGRLAWCALLGGVGASLAANVAAAQPDLTARMVAAWPALAFAVGIELLLQQRRPLVGDPSPAGRVDRAPEGEPVPTGQAPPAAAVEPWAPTELAPTEPALPTVRVPEPEPTPEPEPAAAPPAGVDLPTRIAALVAEANAAGQNPPGRRRLAALLVTTEHAVRVASTRNGADSEGDPR